MPGQDLGEYDVQPVDHDPFQGLTADSPPQDYDLQAIQHDPFVGGIGSDARFPASGPEPMDENDRDALIKTVYGEARGEPELAQAGITHAILNRVKAGGYGDSISSVVKAPAAGVNPRLGYHEFSPWNTGRATEGQPAIATLDRDNPAAYSHLGRIVDNAYYGITPDPTGGATHYYGVMRGHPSWSPPLAAQNSVKIGNTTFVGRAAGPGQAGYDPRTRVAQAGYQEGGGVTDLGFDDQSQLSPLTDDHLDKIQNLTYGGQDPDSIARTMYRFHPELQDQQGVGGPRYQQLYEAAQSAQASPSPYDEPPEEFIERAPQQDPVQGAKSLADRYFAAQNERLGPVMRPLMSPSLVTRPGSGGFFNEEEYLQRQHEGLAQPGYGQGEWTGGRIGFADGGDPEPEPDDDYAGSDRSVPSSVRIGSQLADQGVNTRPYTAADIVAGKTPFGKQELKQYDDPTLSGQVGTSFEHGAERAGAPMSVVRTAGDIGQFVGGLTGVDAPYHAEQAYRYGQHGAYGQALSEAVAAVPPIIPGAAAEKAVARDVVEDAAKTAGRDVVETGGKDVAETAGKGATAAGETGVAPDEIKAMPGVPNIRRMSVDDGTALARDNTHLMPSSGAREGEGFYVGSPASIQSPADLDALRKQNQEYLRGDWRGWDWYNRYRADLHAMSGGDARVGDYLAASHANWSPNRPPSFEFGAASKEMSGALTGEPTRAGSWSQHEDFLSALEQGDPNLMQLGEKTGEYAYKINPRRMFEQPSATGVNDFRNARQWGFPFQKSADAEALTSTEHRWLDYENANLVDWANQNKIGGKTDWNGEQVQAAMWVRQKATDLMEAARTSNVKANATALEKATKAGKPPPAPIPFDEEAEYAKAFGDANTTPRDSYRTNVFHATREMQPGVPGHLQPGAAAAPQAEREEFFKYPGASWINPETGQDILYGGARSPTGAGFHTLSPQEMRGYWRPDPNLPPERNPGIAVPFFPGRMTGETERLSSAGRDVAEQGETLASYMGSQAAGGGHRFVSDNIALKNANAYSFDLPRALTPEEQEAVQAVGEAHGFPHVVDTGQGVRLTNFDGTSPVQNSASRDAFLQDLQGVLPKGAGTPQHGLLEGVYAPSEIGQPGSGDATRRLTQVLGKSWKSWNLWNTHPGLAKVAKSFLERDLAFSERWGPAREDIRNALKIIGDGPGWLDRLDTARKYGLPAATAAGVALTPTAGLPASLPQKPSPDAQRNEALRRHVELLRRPR
jgi:spore germination cell wall hydrolase CwlJ-like protein